MSKKKPAVSEFSIRLPNVLIKYLDALASKNKRTRNAQIWLMLELLQDEGYDE